MLMSADNQQPPRRCTDLVALLADFVERRLPPALHDDLQRHLAACPACEAQLNTYQSTIALLRSLREEDLPRELRCTLKAFVNRNCQN
jgi:anti-sigma factor RsiW